MCGGTYKTDSPGQALRSTAMPFSVEVAAARTGTAQSSAASWPHVQDHDTANTQQRALPARRRITPQLVIDCLHEATVLGNANNTNHALGHARAPAMGFYARPDFLEPL